MIDRGAASPRGQATRSPGGRSGVSSRYRALFESSMAGVYQTTLDGTILEGNPAFAAMLGVTRPEELVGRRITEFFDDPGDRPGMIERLRRGGTLRAEARMRRADGALLWVLGNATLLDREPQEPLILITVVDITARKEAEESLAANERRFRALIERSSEAITVLGADGRLSYVSPAAGRIFGFPPERFRGMDPISILHPDDREPVTASLKGLLDDPGGTVTISARFRHGGGEWRRLEAIVTNMLDDPSVRGIVANTRDVTDRIRAMEELERSERRFRLLSENVRDFVFELRFEPTMHFAYLSPTIGEVTGYEPKAYLDDPGLFYRLIHPDDLGKLVGAAAGPEADGAGQVLLRSYRKDGSIIWTESRLSPVLDEHGRTVGIQGVARDVTERITREEALAEAEARFRGIFEHAVQGVYQTDLQGRYLVANPAEARMLGCDGPAELLDPATGIRKTYVDPQCRDALLAEVARRGFVTNFEAEILRRDGSTLWTWENVRGLFDEQGRLVGLEGASIDVSDRRRAEAALADRETRLRLLVEQSPAVMWTIDRGLRITSVFTGSGADPTQPSPLIGADLHGIFQNGRDEAASVRAHRRALDGFAASFQADFDGSTYEAHVEPLRGPGGDIEGAIGVALDVSERAEAERELQRSFARLREADEVRRMLQSHLVSAEEDERRRIAEDIHDDSIQVMTAAGMRLQILRRLLPNGPAAEQLEALSEVVDKSIARLRSLIFDLRPPALDRQGLAAALRQFTQQSATELGPEFRVTSRLRSEPPASVRGVLYRIARESLTNARRHAGAASVEVTLEEREGGYMVAVADDGRGFEPAEEPDAPGHLGLASMRERAELAGGRVTVTSSHGGGTIVEAWIPAPDAGGAERSP